MKLQLMITGSKQDVEQEGANIIRELGELKFINRVDYKPNQALDQAKVDLKTVIEPMQLVFYITMSVSAFALAILNVRSILSIFKGKSSVKACIKDDSKFILLSDKEVLSDGNIRRLIISLNNENELELTPTQEKIRKWRDRVKIIVDQEENEVQEWNVNQVST